MDLLIKIGCFNIKKCGQKKITEHFSEIKEIVQLYDIIFIQELQQKITDDDIIKLYDLSEGKYSHVLSDIVGRKKYHEFYCFIYNKQKINCLQSETFDDIKNLGIDCFERNPFIGKFSLNISPTNIFYIIGCHTKPTDAISECNKLDDVAEFISKRENINLNSLPLIIMGDLNASSNYVRNDNKMDLHNQNIIFHEITNSKIDTMISFKSNYAYDRIFCTLPFVDKFVSFGVLNLEEILNIDNEKLKKISDHYPLQVTFYFNDK
jgi:endonuclease/exonuclease/phosphatase family metal-dependent hydrolase